MSGRSGAPQLTAALTLEQAVRIARAGARLRVGLGAMRARAAAGRRARADVRRRARARARRRARLNGTRAEPGGGPRGAYPRRRDGPKRNRLELGLRQTPAPPPRPSH